LPCTHAGRGTPVTVHPGHDQQRLRHRARGTGTAHRWQCGQLHSTGWSARLLPCSLYHQECVPSPSLTPLQLASISTLHLDYFPLELCSRTYYFVARWIMHHCLFSTTRPFWARTAASTPLVRSPPLPWLPHMHAHARTCPHMHTCTHMHAHARTCTHMHAHAHTCTHMLTHTHTCTHMHARI